MKTENYDLLQPYVEATRYDESLQTGTPYQTLKLRRNFESAPVE